MNQREHFSLASAFEAAKGDQLARWVGDFLSDPGSDNAPLAAALAERPHYWLGPIRLPIADLVRLAGPNDEDVCAVEPEEWSKPKDAVCW